NRPAPPTLQDHLLDRDYVRNHGKPQERAFYHAASRRLNAEIFRRRRELAEQYLREHQGRLVNPAFAIDPETGLGTCRLDGSTALADAVGEARKRIAELSPEKQVPSKGSLDFLVSSADVPRDSAMARLALDPNLICPIARYFGCLPILFSFDINRARNQQVIQ